MNIEFLIDSLAEHGELHIVIEEHESVAGDGYIGLRSGNTSFDDDAEIIIVYDGRKEHFIPYDRVVYAEPANEFPD